MHGRCPLVPVDCFEKAVSDFLLLREGKVDKGAKSFYIPQKSNARRGNNLK